MISIVVNTVAGFIIYHFYSKNYKIGGVKKRRDKNNKNKCKNTDDECCKNSKCRNKYNIINPKKYTALHGLAKTNSMLKTLLPGFDDVKDIMELIGELKSSSKSKTNENIKTVLKRISTTGASIASVGLGGDIPLKIFFLIDEVHTVLLHVIEFITNLHDVVRIFYDLLNIDFRDGINGIECWVDYIINSYAGATGAYKKMCKMISEFLNTIATFIGNLISAFIPNEPGIITLILQQAIQYGPRGLYNKVKSIYCSKVSKKFKDILENNVLLEDFFIDIFETIRACVVQPGKCVSSAHDKYNNKMKELEKYAESEDEDDAGVLSRAKKYTANIALKATYFNRKKISAVASAVDFGVNAMPDLPSSAVHAMNEFFNELKNKAPELSKIIYKFLSLFFALLYFMTRCTNDDMETIKVIANVITH
jgi:hypothetical protein